MVLLLLRLFFFFVFLLLLVSVCVFARSNKRYLETTSMVGWHEPGRMKSKKKFEAMAAANGDVCMYQYFYNPHICGIIFIFIFGISIFLFCILVCARIRDPNRIGKLDISTANAARAPQSNSVVRWIVAEIHWVREHWEDSLSLSRPVSIQFSHVVNSQLAHTHTVKCHTYGSSLARMRSIVRVRYFMALHFCIFIVLLPLPLNVWLVSFNMTASKEQIVKVNSYQ